MCPIILDLTMISLITLTSLLYAALLKLPVPVLFFVIVSFIVPLNTGTLSPVMSDNHLLTLLFVIGSRSTYLPSFLPNIPPRNFSQASCFAHPSSSMCVAAVEPISSSSSSSTGTALLRLYCSAMVAEMDNFAYEHSHY